MNSIISSASKIVFVVIAITACGAFLYGRLEAKDFMVLSGMAFSFYFSSKGDPNAPFAGK